MTKFKTIKQYNDENMSTKDRLIQHILDRIPNTIHRHDFHFGSVFYDANRAEVIKKGFWIWKYEIWKQLNLFEIIEYDSKEIFITSYNKVISEEMIQQICVRIYSNYTIIYKFDENKPYTVFDTKPKYGWCNID